MIADTPAFAKAHKSYDALTTAATTLTGANSYLTDTPDNTVLLATGGTNGTIITQLSVTPRATITAANCSLWKSSNTGTTKKLWNSVTHPGATVSATAATPSVAFNVPGTTTPISEANPYRLAPGEQLYAGCAVALVGGWQFAGQGVDISDNTV